MSKPTIFEASYYNFEYKRGLKVCRLVFEVPYEAAGLVRDILGDPPGPGEQTNVAIARLMRALPAKPVSAEPESKPEQKRSSLAHLKCGDPEFCKWLRDNNKTMWAQHYAETEYEQATSLLKWLLGIESRSELDTNGAAAARFDALMTDYRFKDMVR